MIDSPAYYCYTVPQPAGIENQPRWNSQLSEFILMYDDVRSADNPDQSVYEFLESTYDVGARLANWDRAKLEI